MDEQQREAARLKAALDQRFFQKGLTIALVSGVSYGLFTAFLNLGLSTGIWGDWAAGALPAFAVTYIVSAMGGALMYMCSAIWSLGLAALQGKLGDFFRSIWTRPGRTILVAGLIGGPIAGTAYVIALQRAGAIVIPITGLNPAIGAVLGWLLYKQKLTPRILLGIAVCFAASMMIAGQSLFAGAPEGMFAGVLMAFAAALGWGLEGCIAGYATAMVDYQVGITIRQWVAGLANLVFVLPLLSLCAGEGPAYSWGLLAKAVQDGPALAAFAASGFFAMFAYSLWYKGNSMCGAALGMAANGTYAFWGPFFSWLLLGVICGQNGWDIPFIGWVSAFGMILGILIIAVDPRALFHKKAGDDA